MLSAATLFSSSSTLLFGGSGGGEYLTDTWTFDGTSWEQVVTPHSPPGRSDASMATLGSKVVLFGGQWDQSGFLNDTWTFDGKDWSQMMTSKSPARRTDAIMAAVGGVIVLFGGLITRRRRRGTPSVSLTGEPRATHRAPGLRARRAGVSSPGPCRL
jgi:hypothetical protein